MGLEVGKRGDEKDSDKAFKKNYSPYCEKCSSELGSEIFYIPDELIDIFLSYTSKLEFILQKQQHSFVVESEWTRMQYMRKNITWVLV